MPVRKPGQSNASVNTLSKQGIDTVNDRNAEEFINKAGQTLEPPPPAARVKPKRKVKIQMMMRIDPDLLDAIDAVAIEEGISRSAWISRTCARALKTET